MRRRPASLVLALSVLVGSVGLGTPAATAQDEPPPGALDGNPVGAAPDPPVDGEPVPDETSGERSESAASAASSPPERYFSRQAFDDIQAAVVAAARPCPVTNNGLLALVMAPIFYESSGAITPSSAPSPMTLSRYDEWNPSQPATTSNLGANRSLYPGRNPYTAYPRGYWHPGIGIWQYDSAGLGAAYTAVERMDARVIAPVVAARVMTRYCNAQAAGQSDLNARKASWGDWVGCSQNGCEVVFQQLTTNGFQQMRLLDGIERLGGTQVRTCSLPGRGTFTCAYVDHRLAQGARWWAVHSSTVPINDGNPTSPPAPLSAPFYVFELDGREHRHWLSADTGYGVSLSAYRTLGRNARYRTDQAGSGLTWATSSSLCDVTADRGACGSQLPTPPSGVQSKEVVVTSNQQAITLDANGDGRGDVLLYGPGAIADALWIGQGEGVFAQVGAAISGTYDHVLTGDVDGDGLDDILWYASPTGSAYLWKSRGDGSFSSFALAPGAQRIPLLLDVDGDDDIEIFWYGPGSISDSLWNWSGDGFVASPRSVSGVYQPIVGDFDRNGRDDIFWYAPGPASDHLWLHRVAGGHLSVARPVQGSYQPVVGDYDGDGADDIFWYAPGPAADSVWFGGPNGSFTNRSAPVNGSYTPLVADLQGDGRDDVIWYAPGPAGDFWWRWSTARSYSSASLTLPAQHQATVGAFSVGGADGVLWHQAGDTPDVIWYR